MTQAGYRLPPTTNQQVFDGSSNIMMDQLPAIIPKKQSANHASDGLQTTIVAGKLLISCTGYSTILINRQWKEMGPPGKCTIEVVPPNNIYLKTVNGEVFQHVHLLPDAKMTKRDNFSFYLRPDPFKEVFYGFRLTENSPTEQFYQMVLQLISSLKLSTGPYIASDLNKNVSIEKRNEIPLEQRPQILQQNFIQSGPQNTTDTTPLNITRNEEETKTNSEENKIDYLCEELAKNIEFGKVDEAMNLVHVLCELKPKVTIHTLPKEASYAEENKFSIIVRVTDREEIEDSYNLSIGDPTKTTIRMLKNEMWKKFRFPIKSQRWVFDRLLPEDNATLYNCGIKQNAQIGYLYLVSVNLEKLIDEKQNIPLQDPVYETIDDYQLQNQANMDQFSPTMQRAPNAQFSPTDPFPLMLYRHQQDQQQFNQYGAQSMWINQSHMPKAHNIQAMNYLQRNFQNPSYQPYQTVVNGARPRLASTVPANPMPFIPRQPLARKRAQQIGWNCNACTYKNPPTFHGCKMCTSPRPDDYQIPEGYEPTKEENDRIESEKMNEKMVLEAEFKRKEREAKVAQENYRQVMNLAQKKVLPNQEEFDCPICYTTIEKGEGVMLRECLHCFCRDCLMLHINTSLDPEVHCPENAGFPCPAVITGQEIEQLLSPEDFAKFLDRSLAQAEHNIENSFHCRTTNCKGWCEYEDDVNEYHCIICAKINCLTCKAQHPDMTCKAYQEDLKIRAENDDAAKKTQQMLDELVNRGDAMHCPQCKVILQKKSGCDWMRCTMCKTEICWATKGPRWGRGGKGDTSAGCKCGVNGQRCTPNCGNCH